MLQLSPYRPKSRTALARSVVVGKMAAQLLQELEGPEIAKLPKIIQNKLERILLDQQYEIDSLKAQQEQFRVDSGKVLSGILYATGFEVFCFSHQCMHTRWLADIICALKRLSY